MEKAPFQIRDFPVELREAIVKAAKEVDQSVGEFMTGICLAAQATGWTRVIGSSNGLSNTQVAETTDLLVQAMCRLAAQKGVPKVNRAAANALIGRQLVMLVPALPPPEPPIAASPPLS